MDKYLFVVNPVSGGMEKNTLTTEIEAFSQRKSIQKEIYRTTGNNDRERISAVVQSFKPTVMVISGGDGTISSMVPVILEHDLVLGIIPVGSANGLAAEFDISLQNAFEILLAGNTRPMDAVYLDDRRYMVHLADFGLNALWVKRYEEENRRGILGYAISALQEIGSWGDPFEVTVKYNGKSEIFRTALLVIANARKYGTGFQINPGGNICDGLVELCFLKELSAGLFFDGLAGEQAHKNNFFDIVAVSEAELISREKIDFQADGEYLGKRNRLKINVLQAKINVIAPS